MVALERREAACPRKPSAGHAIGPRPRPGPGAIVPQTAIQSRSAGTARPRLRGLGEQATFAGEHHPRDH